MIKVTRLLLVFRCVDRRNGGAVENRDRTKSTIYLRKLLSGCVIKKGYELLLHLVFFFFQNKNVYV
jgi:hypothetical protein